MLFLFLTVITIVFSVSNKQIVTIDLHPFPFVLDLPLYLIVLLSIAIGVILSGMCSLVISVHDRKGDYLKTKRIKALEDEIEAIKVDQKVKALL